MPRTVATAAKFGIDPDQAEGSTGIKEIEQNHREGSGLRVFFFIFFILIKMYHLSLPNPLMFYLHKFMEEQYLLRYLY